MSPDLIAVIVGLTALILLLLGIHIGLALGMTGALGILWVTGNVDAFLGALRTTPLYTIANYSFVILPLFILMGLFTYHGGISSSAYDGAYKIIGKVPGGLSIATTLACLIFGATSGSSIASATLFTRVSLPEMRKIGYDTKFACGSIAVASITDQLVPPSTYFVFYGMLTELSIAKLLLAGFLPGILMGFLLCLNIFVIALINPKLAPRASISLSWKEKMIALAKMWPLALLAFIIILGIYTGVFTPTEASAVAAFVAFVLGLIFRGLNWDKLRTSLLETAQVTAMMALIIIGAFIFSRFLAISGLPRTVSKIVIELRLSPMPFMIILMLLYILIGCFMDEISAMCITLPIFFPVMKTMGIDPIWCAVCLISAMITGMITPPFGMAVFAVKASAGPDVTVSGIFKGAMLFYPAVLLALVLMLLFPALSLLIPYSHVGR